MPRFFRLFLVWLIFVFWRIVPRRLQFWAFMNDDMPDCCDLCVNGECLGACGADEIRLVLPSDE